MITVFSHVHWVFNVMRVRMAQLIKTIMILLLASFSLSGWAAEGDAAQLFKEHRSHIYQIRLIDLQAEKKSALGSGFLVTADGVLATNYHVIEGAITKQDKFRIEYLDASGNKGELTLLAVDVANDLALLQSPDLAGPAFELAAQEPQQGNTIYSLGNPHDIGFTVVPGTYNGISDKSFYRRIHFSGSINAGMSGGPTLDSAGRVVGVNVSTAGNQISFLVPVAALQQLLDRWQVAEPVTDFKAEIRRQLQANQQRLVGGMLNRQWPTEPLGEATILAEVAPYVKCWGGSSDDKSRVKQVSSTCQGDEYIYLSNRFTTGTVNYQFFWLEAKELNQWQFYRYYQNLFDSFIADNRVGKYDASNFACEEQFVDETLAGQQIGKEKVVICTRAYREFPGLFDLLFLGGSVHDDDKAFIRHFTLAGVERENGQAFLQRFMETAKWQ